MATTMLPDYAGFGQDRVVPGPSSNRNPEAEPLAHVERTATQPLGVAGVCSVIGCPALEAWSLIEETVLSSP